MDNHFFYFSKGERIGIVVLVVVCIVLFITPTLLPDRSQKQATDFTSLDQQLAAWEEEEGDENSSGTTNAGSARLAAQAFNPNTATREQLQAVGLTEGSVRSWLSYLRKGGKFKDWEAVEKFRALSAEERTSLKPYLLFDQESRQAPIEASTAAAPVMQNFDPNQVDANTLQAMGVPARVANNWVRFLASGGSFRQAEDIQKIYGLSETDFQRLLPYAQVTISATEDLAYEPANTPQAYDARPTNVIIDINQATAEQWQQLRGIGPAFSKRIVNFRTKLGGFHSVQQVAETYGLPDSVFQKISLQLRPSPILHKLAINQATVEELAAHPYLRFSDARLLVNYREEHGPYSGAADLDKLYGLEEKTKVKLLPYLSFK